jgi:hypothetical protein
MQQELIFPTLLSISASAMTSEFSTRHAFAQHSGLTESGGAKTLNIIDTSL